MAEYEPCTGATDDWFTPPEVFKALGLTFDLDPCSPGLGAPHCSVPARRAYTIWHDGLTQPWKGLVYMNPPFGGRHGHIPWLRRFLAHANGIAVVRAYTSADWFHDEVVPHAETLLFPRGKTKFVRGTDMVALNKAGEVIGRFEAGSRGTSPGHGVVLIGMGEQANTALERSGLGCFVRLRPTPLRS